jgi:thiol-disulfide isomerase/thioredoxin
MSERDSRKSASSLIALVLAACLLAGCNPKSAPENTSGRIDADPAAAAPGKVELVIVDREGYDAALAEHRGKVVLVDFWATWCGPCVEQLPHTIDAAERFGNRDLAVITVSFDDPEESTRIADFLRSKGAIGLTNLISQFGAGPQSFEVFDIDNGAVPHYKLYDRSGELRHTFGVDPKAPRQFTLAEIDTAIEQLLAE